MAHCRLLGWALAWASGCMLLAGAAQADVDRALNQPDAQSEIVFLVPNPQAYSEQLLELVQQWDLPDVEHAEDPLSAMLGVMGLSEEHLDLQAPLMVSLSGLEQSMRDGEEPQWMLFVGVQDYAGFVESLGGDAEQEVTAITLDHDSGYARQVNGFAVIAEHEDVLDDFEPGEQAEQFRQRLGERGQAELDRASAAIYVDLPGVARALAAAVQEHEALIDELVEEVEEELAAADDPMAGDMWPLADKAMDGYVNVMQMIAEEGEAGILAHTISDQGTGLSGAAHFDGGGRLMEYFPGQGSDLDALLAGLPDRSFLYASVVDMRNMAFDELAGMLFRDLMPEDDPFGMHALYGGMVPMLEQSDQVAYAVYAPQIALMGGGTLIDMVSLYRGEDGQALRASHQQYIEDLDGQVLRDFAADPFADPWAADEPDGDAGGFNGAAPIGPDDVVIETRYEADTFQVDGLDVDRYSVELTFPGMDAEDAMMEMAMVADMLAYEGYIAVKDDVLVVTTSEDVGNLRSALEHLDDGQGIGSGAAFTQAFLDEAVVEPAGLVSYMSMQGFAEMANSFLAMMGMQVEIAADTPPVAFSAGSDGQTISFRAYTAHTTIQNTVEAFMRMEQQMMGDPMGPPIEVEPAEPAEPAEPGGPREPGPPPF